MRKSDGAVIGCFQPTDSKHCGAETRYSRVTVSVHKRYRSVTVYGVWESAQDQSRKHLEKTTSGSRAQSSQPWLVFRGSLSGVDFSTLSFSLPPCPPLCGNEKPRNCSRSLDLSGIHHAANGRGTSSRATPGGMNLNLWSRVELAPRLGSSVNVEHEFDLSSQNGTSPMSSRPISCPLYLPKLSL